jgi:hypothetical protein
VTPRKYYPLNTLRALGVLAAQKKVIYLGALGVLAAQKKVIYLGALGVLAAQN